MKENILNISQALVAEKVDYNESIDLYRHCVDLSNHVKRNSIHIRKYYFVCLQCQSLYGYGKAIASLLVKPENKPTRTYAYAINDLNGNQRAADALTKYIRKFSYNNLKIVVQRVFLERNRQDTHALQCLGIIHEFNRRFIQAANAYQLYKREREKSYSF